MAVCCQDEIGLPSSSGQGEFTVEDAKEFFETNVIPTVLGVKSMNEKEDIMRLKN